MSLTPPSGQNFLINSRQTLAQLKSLDLGPSMESGTQPSSPCVNQSLTRCHARPALLWRPCPGEVSQTETAGRGWCELPFCRIFLFLQFGFCDCISGARSCQNLVCCGRDFEQESCVRDWSSPIAARVASQRKGRDPVSMGIHEGKGVVS